MAGLLKKLASIFKRKDSQKEKAEDLVLEKSEEAVEKAASRPDAASSQIKAEEKAAEPEPEKPAERKNADFSRSEIAGMISEASKKDFKFRPLGRIAAAVKTGAMHVGGSENKNTVKPRQSAAQKRRNAKYDLRYPVIEGIDVIAFIGPSGTGKSTKALKIAGERGISWLIDDGLLIKGSTVISGTSAKKADTMIASVKRAIFDDETRSANVRRNILQQQPDKIMILGTSYSMIERICNNLGLHKPVQIINIEDVSTEEERRMAREIRLTQGKHTIPVPGLEIKHEFSGYIAEPIAKLKKKLERGGKAEMLSDEKTVVRPTFSALGSYSISDEALSMMVALGLREIEGFGEVISFRAEKEAYGVFVSIDLALLYGYNAQTVLRKVQKKAAADIEKYASINVLGVNVSAVKLMRERSAEVL